VTLRASGLALLLVFAGCSGLSPPPASDSTETLTPVPVPDAERRTATPSPPVDATAVGTARPAQLAPGVARTGIVDRFAFVDAHVAGVTAASYTVNQTTTVRYQNGSIRTQQIVTAHVAVARARYRLIEDVTGPAASRVRAPAGRFELWTGGERFFSVFRPSDGPPEFARIGSVAPGTDARNASLELVVDSRGRIRRDDLSYTAVVAGERRRVTRRSRYEIGGVRVDRPDWYGAALNATEDSGGTATIPGPSGSVTVMRSSA
jgi:hypothetical protein